MKEQVTIEEINAATMLLLGISVNKLIEVHINSGAVSGIAANDDGSLVAVRAGVAPQATMSAADEEPTEAEIIEDDR